MNRVLSQFFDWHCHFFVSASFNREILTQLTRISFVSDAIVSPIRQTIGPSLSVIFGISFLAWKHPNKTLQDRSRGPTGYKVCEEAEMRCFLFSIYAIIYPVRIFFIVLTLL